MDRTRKIAIVIICLLSIILLWGIYLKFDMINFSAFFGIALSIIAIILALDALSLITKVKKLVDKVLEEEDTIKKLIADKKINNEIFDVTQETKEVEDKSDLPIDEKEFDIKRIDKRKLEQDYLDVDYILSEEIIRWSNKKQYPSSVVFIKPIAETIDYILETKDGPVPIELKVYPKRIISNNLPGKLRDRMKNIMDLSEASSSILIILNPEITNRAKTMIQETNRKIVIIQDKNKEKLRIKFRKYLETLYPAEI